MRLVRRNADRRLLLEMKDDQVSLIMCLAIYGGETSLRLCRMMRALSRVSRPAHRIFRSIARTFRPGRIHYASTSRFPFESFAHSRFALTIPPRF